MTKMVRCMTESSSPARRSRSLKRESSTNAVHPIRSTNGPEVLGEAPPGLDVHLHEFAKIAVLRRLGAAVGDLPDVVRTILEDADRAIFSPRLVKAFMKIPRPAVRHRLVALVREIAGDDGE